VTGVVVEREAELAALGEAIASGGVLVVAGPPGIGKSTLLRAAAAGAAQDGTRVLVAAGTPLERGFAFGTARALLEAPVAALPAG
jgi:predicted ATP-dependent serine protease